MKNKQKKNYGPFLLFLYFTLLSFLTFRTFQLVNINQIKIKGSELFSKNDLINNSSLTFPIRLISVKTNLIEKELKNNLSLKYVSVQRQLIPFGLKILIKTRKPVAQGERTINGKKIEGYVDRYGFFIKAQHTDKKNLKKFPTRVYGWEENYKKTISEVFSFQKISNIELVSINFSPNGFLTLEEKELNKILLGFDPNLIKDQLRIIDNIKNQLKENSIFKKIENIDITNPINPKIKVFKP